MRIRLLALALIAGCTTSAAPVRSTTPATGEQPLVCKPLNAKSAIVRCTPRASDER